MNFLSAFVDIIVDDSKLPQQLAKAKSVVTRTVAKIKASFSKMATSFKAAFNKMVRIAKWGSLVIAGALALSVRSAMKQEDAIKRLEITLKATGHAAGFTAKQLLQQASALQKVTRFGDETIIAMQTMLLTFKNIKGDEFKRATEAALDMATAEAAVSGRAVDLTSTSIRLGKALNDPLLGMTALSRVGVQFTDTQKALVEQLVKTGRVAEAQNIILTELETQFGGMSRDVDTASGALKQMWNALGDVTEKIGGAFLPGIKSSATAVKKWAEDNQERLGHWAEITVAYIAYVKDVLWAFVKFLHSDWQAGWKYAKDVSIAAMKDASAGILKTVDNLGEELYEKLTTGWGKRIHDAIRDMLTIESWRETTLGKVVRYPFQPSELKPKEETISPIIKSPRQIEAEALIREAKKFDAYLKTQKQTSELSQIIAPPELAIKFEEAGQKLQRTLEDIKQKAEDIEEPMEKALVKPIVKADEKLKEQAVELERIYQDIASTMARSWADALDQMMFEGKKFGAAMKDMFRNLIRMITQIVMYQTIAEPIAKGIISLIPGAIAATATPAWTGAPSQRVALPQGGGFGLQHGGEVMKTGWAKVHKGETFSGVGGNYGKTTVNVNNTVSDRVNVEVDEYMQSDQRIIDVTMRYSENDGPYRRSIKRIG